MLNWEKFISGWQKSQVKDMGPGFASSVPLCKRDLPFLKRNKYWVCEKSEGVRVLVLVLSAGMYFWDECDDIFFMPRDFFHFPSSGNLRKQQNMTLIDGELTFNYHFDKYALMISDILYCENEEVSSRPFSTRLREIRDNIIVPFRSYYKGDNPDTPFNILGKEVFPVTSVNKILERINCYDGESNEEKRYMYESSKRYNDNDGLIFIPENKDYKPWRCISLKHWQWPELSTVSFHVKITYEEERPIFKFFTMIPEKNQQLIEYRRIYLSPNCTKKILHDLNGADEAIIDCHYDFAKSGEWKYHNIDSTKKHPDSMNAIVEKMESLADGINSNWLIESFSESAMPTPEGQCTPQISLTEKIEVVYESPETLSGHKRLPEYSEEMLGAPERKKVKYDLKVECDL